MKQRLFSKGKGWYISASNYRNKEDKAYMNVHFAKCVEPEYHPTADSEFVFIDIDILEQKYGAYNGKMTLTVFNYKYVESKSNGLMEIDRQNNEFAESIQGTEYAKNFGSNLNISPDDLPFY